MLKKVIWSIVMNRCFFTYIEMYPKKTKEIIIEFLSNNNNIKLSQIILKKPLPFVNGKLAPAEYFYSLFTIEELADIENFKPKVFLVIDKSLDGKEIKIGDKVFVKLVYVDVDF